MEYILPQRNLNPPIFVFVVDLCLSLEDFESLKEQILVSLNFLPPNALVGLVTQGKNVNVYELVSMDSDVSYAFNGAKEYTLEQVQRALGFVSKDMRAQGQLHANAARFLQPVNEAEFVLTTILENLAKDEWQFANNERCLRATGAALTIVNHFLASAYPKAGAQVLLFAGGPCTYGPGKIVSNELKEPIRSHHLIDQGHAKHYKAAKKFYRGLSKACTLEGTTVNVFIGAYDQIGLMEMEVLVKESGGMIVLSDSFTTSIFKQSLQKFLTTNDVHGNLIIGLNSTLEVKTSKQLKISGFIGNGLSLNRDSQFVSKTASSTDKGYGLTGTSAWKLSTIFANSSYAVFFEVAEDVPINSAVVVQFVTFYNNVDGTTRLKVTTVAKPVKFQDFQYFFDQETATVLISRIAVNKINTGTPSAEAVRYVDETLIQFLKKFATFLKNDVNSFSLIHQHSMLPQFIYHLKRSPFLQNFNNSPDESVFYRHYLSLEDTNNSLVMIQPTLTAFDQDHINQVDEDGAVDGDEDEEKEYGIPVLLDSVSILPERILLLDTFFHLLIFHGETVTGWKEHGYQYMEEYANFKRFLEIPRLEAANLLVDRFPLPRFIDCQFNDSQSRFLYSRLNPTSNNTVGDFDQVGLKILNEDMRLQDFLQILKEKVVKS